MGMPLPHHDSWERTHRFHHVKLLPVLHLMDLVDIFHWGFEEVDSLFVQEFISLRSTVKIKMIIWMASCWWVCDCQCVCDLLKLGLLLLGREIHVFVHLGVIFFTVFLKLLFLLLSDTQGQYDNKCFFSGPLTPTIYTLFKLPLHSLVYFIYILTEFKWANILKGCLSRDSSSD